MKVLAIETSGTVASVAVADENQIYCEYTTNFKLNHSVTLMPMIEELKAALDLDLKSLGLIAVSAGPGSFTGLRIGSSTAKGIAHALNLPIAAVPTLEVLANNISKTDHLICPMMDAKRHQVYTALYCYQGDTLVPLTEMMAVDTTEILTQIQSYNRPVILLGDGIQPNLATIKSHLTAFTIAPNHLQLQRASVLATLGLTYAQKGILEDYLTHAPIYLRKPQAEREYDERHGLE